MVAAQESRKLGSTFLRLQSERKTQRLSQREKKHGRLGDIYIAPSVARIPVNSACHQYYDISPERNPECTQLAITSVHKKTRIEHLDCPGLPGGVNMTRKADTSNGPGHYCGPRWLLSTHEDHPKFVEG